MADKLLTMTEAAQAAGLTRKAIDDAAARGALILSAWPADQPRRPGGVRLFGVRRDELERFLSEREKQRICPVCQTTFPPARGAHGAISAQEYCSPRCRTRAATRMAIGLPISDRERAEVIYEINCLWCGTLIYTPNRNQMFCTRGGHSCRQMDYAARKRATERRA